MTERRVTQMKMSEKDEKNFEKIKSYFGIEHDAEVLRISVHNMAKTL